MKAVWAGGLIAVGYRPDYAVDRGLSAHVCVMLLRRHYPPSMIGSWQSCPMPYLALLYILTHLSARGMSQESGVREPVEIEVIPAFSSERGDTSLRRHVAAGRSRRF